MAATGPTVQLEKAAALVLRRQGLAGPGLRSVMEATVACAGIYATAPTCYLTCAARVDAFRIADLDAELYERRALLRLRAMRGSSYIVPIAAVPMVVAATNPPGDIGGDFFLKAAGLEARTFARLADRIEAVMTDREPATVPEIRKLLGPPAPGRPDALQYAVAAMCRHGRLVRAEVRGAWRSDTYAYARWADWLGAPLAEVDPVDARTALARAYLGAFGPATANDLAWWAGWKATAAAAALHTLAGEVATVTLREADGAGTFAYCLAGDLDALLQAEGAAGQELRLLPVWDTYLMGYRERRRFVSDADYGRAYDKSGNATSVVLRSGRVVGVWEFVDFPERGRTTLALRVAPFGRTSARWWVDVESAAARLGRAIGARDVRVGRAPEPGVLAEGARNAFLAPIRLGAAPP